MRFFLIWILFLSQSGQSEYRAFLLVIQNTETKVERTLISTMDPLQYPSYYQLRPNETIVYTDTWMCRNRTNLKKICDSPRKPASDKTSLEPNNTNAP